MKYILPLLLLFLVACGDNGAETGEIPASLDEKRELLRQKRAEMKELTRFVTALEDAIAAQDPNAVAQRTLVTATELKPGEFSRRVSIQGTVQAEDLADATAEMAGRILRLTVEEGDNVRRGQLIATIDVEQVEKQIEEVETSLGLARTVYERQKKLWDQNIGSEIQYLEAKNTVERLEKNLESLRIQLKKRNVYAPISGSVERVVLQSGELAAPGAPIVQILNTSDLQVEADVPERYLSAVSVGESVQVRIPALSLDFSAPITLIGRTIDPANRTFKIEIDLQQRNTRLKPNLLAEVLIQDYREENAIVVPLDRVQQEVSGQKYVMLVEQGPEGPVARKKDIAVGEAYEGRIVVTEGLQGGEQLILEGARGLADGQPIEITQAKTAVNE